VALPKSSDFGPSSPDFGGPDSGQSGHNLVCRNQAMTAGHCRILFFAVGVFFVQTKGRKIFSEKSFIYFLNDFVQNILRRKSFYIETNGA
jgi:hypothetical protein